MQNPDQLLHTALEHHLIWLADDVRFVEAMLNIQDRTPDQLRRLQMIADQLNQSHDHNNLLGEYFDFLRPACQHLPLDVLDPSERTMNLDQVYIDLETPNMLNLTDQASMPLLAAMAHQPTLVILGAPGSGKSTFTKHIALEMTKLLSNYDRTLQAKGWRYARPHVPIRVELRQFADWLTKHPTLDDSHALWNYLQDLFNEKGLANPSTIRETLHKMYTNYGALLLLDGLDEVPSGTILQRLLNSIEALNQARRSGVPSHLVVTCRIRDYTEDPQRQLQGWPTAHILPLSDDLQAQFIASWYQTLEHLDRLRDRDFKSLDASLLQQLKNRHELQRMAPNPLLLTMIAHVHSLNHLPDSRVELYERCVDLLLLMLKRNKQIKTAASAIAEVLDTCQPLTNQGTQRATILAELLLELDLENINRIRTYQQLPTNLIQNHYLPLFTEQAASVDIHLRHIAALKLGKLGDPRPGVSALEPAWVEIPAGPFIYGSSDTDQQAFDDEKPQRTLELPTYWIANYPTTNAQFRYFIEFGGYTTERWWTPYGWQECQQKKWTEPRFWYDQRFNGPNQPVVGVSWYESAAYCTWLSEHLGQEVRLPSEVEWEKAARGTDGHIYPWGDDWHESYANTNTLNLRQTSAVGLFVAGASSYGCYGMAGNVWEWSANVWDEANRTDSILLPSNKIDISNKGGCCVRGGSWLYGARFVRCACRYGEDPNCEVDDLGFRPLTVYKPNSQT